MAQLYQCRCEMKATIILVFLCTLVVAVWSRRPDPELQPYPIVFTAVYNESDQANYFRAPRMNTVSLDLPNKRAIVTYPSDNGNPESWILIYRPDGADPTAPASQGYTGFNINPDYPSQVPDDCLYTTGNLMSLAPFPHHWKRKRDPWVQEIDTWYNLPSDLVYAGEYFIAELGVTSDRWDTVSQCLLEQSGIGQVPCASVMFSQGQNPLPLMDIRAFGAHEDSFESDKYNVRVYHSFVTSVQDSAFTLPNNWEVSCVDADNGFLTQPVSAFTVYNATGSDATLQVALSSPPIKALGDVKVTLLLVPTWYYDCEDCVTFSPNSLIFTQSNWNVSQPLPAKFNRNGCSQYVIRATGGGYDWTYYGKTIVVYSCEGSSVKGCSERPKCKNQPPSLF